MKLRMAYYRINLDKTRGIFRRISRYNCPYVTESRHMMQYSLLTAIMYGDQFENSTNLVTMGYIIS